MTRQASNIPLIVFAKAPIAGRVKTRLQPQLTEHQSAEVAKLLLSATLQRAVQYWPGQVVLSAGLDARHPFLLEMAASFQLPLEQQPAGDLGQRMAATMNQFGYPAAIIGSDIPQVSECALRTAYSELQQGHNIIGPSDDGGYYLIGLANPAQKLFEQISWGSEKVLNQTLQQSHNMSLKLQQLAVINDVDTWQELKLAARHVPQLQRYLDSLSEA